MAGERKGTILFHLHNSWSLKLKNTKWNHEGGLRAQRVRFSSSLPDRLAARFNGLTWKLLIFGANPGSWSQERDTWVRVYGLSLDFQCLETRQRHVSSEIESDHAGAQQVIPAHKGALQLKPRLHVISWEFNGIQPLWPWSQNYPIFSCMVQSIRSTYDDATGIPNEIQSMDMRFQGNRWVA